MDLDSPAVSYALLVIPTIFALAVLLQGIIKTQKEESDGPVALVLGVVLLIVIVLAYFFFIR